MTSTVLGLIATVVSFLVWLWKRKAKNDELPTTALKKYEDEARKIVANRADVNILLDERVRAIARNTGGPGGDVGRGGNDGQTQWIPRPTSADAGDSRPVGKEGSRNP